MACTQAALEGDARMGNTASPKPTTHTEEERGNQEEEICILPRSHHCPSSCDAI